MRLDRQWIDARLKNGYLKNEFIADIEEFVQLAESHPTFMDGTKIKCPCNQRKCQNRSFYDRDTVRLHLAKYEFVPNYYIWYKHGKLNNEISCIKT